MKKRRKIIGVIGILICIFIISIYCLLKFYSNPYKKIIPRNDGTIGLTLRTYKNEKEIKVVKIPDKFKGKKVSSVKVLTQTVSKVVLPDELEYLDIEECSDLDEVVMPSNFKPE